MDPTLMDLTFLVPMRYCSLRNQTLVPSPVTSTVGRCFHCSSAPFSSELFLQQLFSSMPFCSSVGHPLTWGVNVSVSYLFVFSYFFTGFSRQKYWSDLPFLSPVDSILPQRRYLKKYCADWWLASFCEVTLMSSMWNSNVCEEASE